MCQEHPMDFQPRQVLAKRLHTPAELLAFISCLGNVLVLPNPLLFKIYCSQGLPETEVLVMEPAFICAGSLANFCLFSLGFCGTAHVSVGMFLTIFFCLLLGFVFSSWVDSFTRDLNFIFPSVILSCNILF